MANILFITGCSASGKTTLYESLQNDQELTEIIFHDIDENGAPPVGRGPWREYRVEQLLYDATLKADEGYSTVICGNTFTHEVTESLYYPPSTPVFLIALTATEQDIRNRLLERARIAKESEVFDECFDEKNIENNIYENIRNQGIVARSVEALKRGMVVNTENLTKNEVHEKVKNVLLNFAKEN